MAVTLERLRDWHRGIARTTVESAVAVKFHNDAADCIDAYVKTLPVEANTRIDDVLARTMYVRYIDSSGIHPNKFPKWHELTEAQRNEYRDKVKHPGESE